MADPKDPLPGTPSLIELGGLPSLQAAMDAEKAKTPGPVQDFEDVEDFTGDISDAKTMGLPTVFIDSYTSQYWSGHIRLVLGEESPSGERFWRFSILMQTREVRGLIRHLTSVLKSLDDTKTKPK